MIKKILIGLILFALVLGVALFYPTIGEIFAIIISRTILLPFMVAAIAIQLVGHLFRARRTKIILDQAAPSSLRFQFGVLSIGYLFNTVFSLRIGELIRAFLVAKRLKVSFLYTFTAVFIERATDLIFLGLVIIIFAILFPGLVAAPLLTGAIVAASIATITIFVLVLLKNENKLILKSVSTFSHLFNTSINNSIRFKVWSLIFGLQNFFNNKLLVRKYVIYAVISWVCYLVSTMIIVAPLLASQGFGSIIFTTISSYVVVLPSTIFLTHDVFAFMASLLHIDIGMAESFATVVMLWILLSFPISFVGFVSLFLYKTKNKKRATITRPDAYTNKLLRYDDISQDFPAFLETYFNGSGLSKILHKIEVNGELSLVRFFKGGSDAITVLALKDEKLFVKKIVPAEYTDRLKIQYSWLKKFEDKKGIVSVTSEQKTDDYYAIDLEYNPINISLFEYVHTRSLKQSKAIISDVWGYVFKTIYKLEAEKVHMEEFNTYVEDRLLNKMKKAVAESHDLAEIVKEKEVRINGRTYKNFYQVLELIQSDKNIWRDLATYRQSKVSHGDLTVDNILVNTETEKPYIIDPSDDNQVKGPIIDFARHMQSLIAGYEFLNNDEEPTFATIEGSTVAINYHDRRSARYMQLANYFNKTLSKKYFTENERKSVLFHVGLLYGRMLAHRVVINPTNTLKYYAVCVVSLNQFYDQYKKT